MLETTYFRLQITHHTLYYPFQITDNPSYITSHIPYPPGMPRTPHPPLPRIPGLYLEMNLSFPQGTASPPPPNSIPGQRGHGSRAAGGSRVTSGEPPHPRIPPPSPGEPGNKNKTKPPRRWRRLRRRGWSSVRLLRGRRWGRREIR